MDDKINKATPSSSADLQSHFDRLKQHIKATIFPTSFELPFVPNNIFYLHNLSQFFLVSSHYTSCNFSLEIGQVSETKTLIDHINYEMREIAFVDPDTLAFYDSYFQLFTLSLSTAQLKMLKEFRMIRRIISTPSSSNLFILSNRIFVYSQGRMSQIPHFWEGRSYMMDISPKQEYLALATTAPDRVYLYSLAGQKVISHQQLESEAKDVKLTRGFLICAVRGNLRVWNLRTGVELPVKRGSTKKYTSIDVNPAETLLAAGCEDGGLHIWDLTSLHKCPVKIEGYHEPIDKVGFMTEARLFYFSTAQSRLMVYDALQIPEELEIEMPPSTVKDILCVEGKVWVNLESHGVLCLDETTFEQIQRGFEDTDVLLSSQGQDTNVTINLQHNKTIKSIQVQTQKEAIFKENDQNWWITALAHRPESDQILLGMSSGSISVMKSSLQLVKDCKIHNCLLSVLIVANSGEFSISGDVGGNIYTLSLTRYNITGEFKGHNSPVTALALSSGDDYFMSGSSDGVIRVTDVYAGVCLKTIKYHGAKINKLHIASDISHFMVCTQLSVFTIWSMDSMSLLSKKSGVDIFAVSPDESKLIIASSGVLQSLRNPLTCRQLTAMGGSSDTGAFFLYCHRLIERENPHYQRRFNDWLVMPYRVNVMHLYAYMSYTKYLRRALRDNCFFVKALEGSTPLTICINNKSLVISEMVEFLVKKMRKNKEFHKFFKNCLLALTRMGVQHLPSLYNELFTEVHYKQLPESCAQDLRLPIVIRSIHSYKVDKREFFPSKYDGPDKSIEFKQFIMKQSLVIGSQDSIHTLQSILDCPRKEIFRSEYINMMINFKWEQVWYVMMVQGLLYFTYLAMLLFFISSVLDTDYLIALLVMNIILSAYEFLQLKAMRMGYFVEILNIVDMIRSSTLFLYFVMWFLGVQEKTTHDLLVFIVVISLIRGLSFFRIFGNTRYMIYLIMEVFQDMYPFMILLGYSIIGVSMVFMTIDHTQSRGDFWYYLEAAYHLALGSYELEGFSNGERILTVGATLINMIVMLNLLISILGDTFDKVQQMIVETDMRAITEMVLEVEQLMFWKRNLYSEKYFFMCRESNVGFDESDQWEGKIRMLYTRLDKMKKEILSSVQIIVRKEIQKSSGQDQKEVEEKVPAVELPPKPVPNGPIVERKNTV